MKRDLSYQCSSDYQYTERPAIKDESQMPHPLIEEARIELEQAQMQLDSALRAWDTSVSELWRTSIALTQAQKRVTNAHGLLRNALDAASESNT